MSRILFVDDDPNVLRGLRDGLRRNRRTWTMTFVESGEQALEFLDGNEVDVIVSDMRMPGMDGADLLEQVRIKHPTMTRLVLSGHSQREQLVRASAVAHQYLSKPCDVKALRDVLARIFDARERTANSTAHELVGQLNGLPMVGAMHQELMQHLGGYSDPGDALAILLSRDSDLTMRVAELVGRAYPEMTVFGVTGQELIDTIGFQAVRSLSVASLVAADLERSDVSDAAQWLVHSARCARLTRELTQRDELKEIAFASGVLHDIGRVVHWLNDSQACAVLDENSIDGDELCQLETKQFGVDHAETGGFLLESWGLNGVIARVCAMHHGAGLDHAGSSDDEVTAQVIAETLQRANNLVHQMDRGDSFDKTELPDELEKLWCDWSADHAVPQM